LNVESFGTSLAQADPATILTRLVAKLEQDQQYAAWFEALKLQARYDLGLEPWQVGAAESIPPAIQRQLEDRLVEACRVVGERMIAGGRISEGWMYLRPVGDHQRAVELLHQLEPNDQQVDQIIEVAIGHGVSPAWGFQLLIDRMGTCNAITAFDTQMATAPLEERQQAATLLLQRLHRELCRNILQHWRRTTTADDPNASPPATAARDLEDSFDLAALIDRHPELTADQNYHVDTSHLSSVVRIGRIVDDPAVQQLAWQLCRYGQHLAELFQPQGYVVFDPYYLAHQTYYEILLHPATRDLGLQFFRDRRATLTADAQQPTVLSLEGQIEATDVLVELLMRCQLYSPACEVLRDQLQICGDHQRSRWTALLFRCCQQACDFEPMLQYSRELGDTFGLGLAMFYQVYQEQRA
jgi:hypothetical protein